MKTVFLKLDPGTEGTNIRDSLQPSGGGYQTLVYRDSAKIHFKALFIFSFHSLSNEAPVFSQNISLFLIKLQI